MKKAQPAVVAAPATALLKQQAQHGLTVEARERFTRLSAKERTQVLQQMAAEIRQDPEAWLPLVEVLFAAGPMDWSGVLDDAILRDLIVVVKHHRPRLALTMLPLMKNARERLRLGVCVAELWGHQDITGAWDAIARSPLPASERLAMHSLLV